MEPESLVRLVSKRVCYCTTEAQPTVQRTTVKKGPNLNRVFHTCAKPQGKQCGYFQWADEAPPVVVNESGLKVIHASALDDLEALEREMLSTGSYYINKYEAAAPATPPWRFHLTRSRSHLLTLWQQPLASALCETSVSSLIHVKSQFINTCETLC